MVTVIDRRSEFRTLLKVLLPLSVVLSLASCLSTGHRNLFPIPGDYAYHVPSQMDDGLPTGTIDGTLFNTKQMAALHDFFANLKKGAFGEIHSVLMVYQGKLVLEEYYPGYRFNGGLISFTASERHHLASVTKSLTSLCVGIAIDKGFIRSVDQPFLDYYRDVTVPNRTEKEGITLRNLLTMTAGLAWDESTFPYTDLRNDIVRLYLSPDPLSFILARKRVSAPGARWVYSGACPNLLGDIVCRASGYPLDRFAKKFLFAPLGISDVTWITLNKGFIYASGDAELRPRDMAKIGMLVLNRGMWNGQRVISEEWLDQSMRSYARANAANEYGFLWWLPTLPGPAAESLGPVYMANGWGDQYIVIVPKHDLVVIVTGGNYDNQYPARLPILNYMLNCLFL